MIELIVPALDQLPRGVEAMRRGWSPSTIDPLRAAREEIERIEHDGRQYIEGLTDRGATGGPITLPDGSSVPRLPGLRRWIWDGDFCGIASLRWQPKRDDLPHDGLGHAGYSVVPWQRGRGVATRALALLLDVARQEGLSVLELITSADNVASQRVVARNGGVLVGRLDGPALFEPGEALRYRIELGH